MSSRFLSRRSWRACSCGNTRLSLVFPQQLSFSQTFTRVSMTVDRNFNFLNISRIYIWIIVTILTTKQNLAASNTTRKFFFFWQPTMDTTNLQSCKWENLFSGHRSEVHYVRSPLSATESHFQFAISPEVLHSFCLFPDFFLDSFSRLFSRRFPDLFLDFFSRHFVEGRWPQSVVTTVDLNTAVNIAD